MSMCLKDTVSDNEGYLQVYMHSVIGTLMLNLQ